MRASTNPTTHVFPDDGVFPNNRLPVIVYSAALATLPERDPASAFEALFDRNGWGPKWLGLTRLSLLVPLLLLTIGVDSCDTAAPLYAVDGATGTSDAGTTPDSSIADVAATDDAGTVADAAPGADIESMADAVPTTDSSGMAEDGVVADGPAIDGDGDGGGSGDGGGGGAADLAPISTLTIDFTDPGAHVFAAEWLVFQPDESGTVDAATEIASTWSTHPRAVEAQSLSYAARR